MNLEDELKRYRDSLSGEDDTDYEEKDDSQSGEYWDPNQYQNHDDYFQPAEDEVLSLQHLCLRNIKNNFQRFNIAFATSKDTALRRNLLFLRRVYSDHMIKEMDGEICDPYLPFLLNEYLKELDPELLDTCTEEAIIKQLSDMGHSLIKFNAIPLHFDRKLVKKMLTHLPSLQILHIPTICDNEILRIIASSCPKLEELHIDDGSVTDLGVKSLFTEIDGNVQVKCHLKIFSLMNTRVYVPGVTYLLKFMPSLQILRHDDVPSALCSMHIRDIQRDSTNKYYNLTELDFLVTDVSINLPVCAKVCPYVKKVFSPVITEKHLELISLFPELEDLSLEGPHYTNETSINDFFRRSGGKLKRLRMRYFSLSVLNLLQSCPMLESLQLSNITFQWEHKYKTSKNIPSLNRLHTLTLEHFSFEEHRTEMSVASILNSSPKLECLKFNHCELHDYEINSKLNTFCANNTLQKLSFEYSNVNITLLESILLTCSSLHDLSVHDCESIDAEHIDSLYEIIRSKKTKININYKFKSEFDSFDEDFFNDVCYSFDEDTDDDHSDYYDEY